VQVPLSLPCNFSFHIQVQMAKLRPYKSKKFDRLVTILEDQTSALIGRSGFRRPQQLCDVVRTELDTVDGG